MFWSFVKRILFKLDAERVHELSIALMRSAARRCPYFLRFISKSPKIEFERSPAHFPMSRFFSWPMCSPLGLAAGFDKNAEIIEALPHLGFGFVEIGTVTPLPQGGNSRPRLFRDPPAGSLFNRMGFNNEGAKIVSVRLARSKESLPEIFKIGVNVGKNKNTSNNSAHSDYRVAAAAFRGLADFLVINLSSPNTPGLRSLQSGESFSKIIQECKEEILSWPKSVPLLVKLAPELDSSALEECIRTGEKLGADGWVLTNTFAASIDIKSKSGTQNYIGGVSGRALQTRSREILVRSRSLTTKPIISVGGIDSVREAQKRLELGASLVEIYSSWIFQGPRFPPHLSAALNFELSKLSGIHQY